MERTIKLSLRQKNGEYKEFMTDFVPYSKRQEYVSLENKLREKYKGKQEEPDMSEYDEMQAEFVAGLFNSKEVTKKTIMDGLDTIDSEKIGEIIRYRVLGFSKEEDDLRKKAITEKLLAGEISTTSI